MRIGGNILKEYKDVEEWLAIVKDLNYSTVLSPVSKENATEDEIEAFLLCAGDNDITIGEVGVWNNPISPKEDERLQAIAYCKRRLALAERLGANCCVNVGGAKGDVWSGCYKGNFSHETYTQLVETIQEIIDAVKPTKTFFTIEPMPWMVPHSPEQYLQLIKDVDRQAFGVHLDFVNMINNPERYALRDEFIDHCFDLLGPFIKSIHLKDLKGFEEFPCHLEECPPGDGDIDLGKVLVNCEAIGEDVSVFVEHMDAYEDYKKAVAYVRALAREVGVTIK